MTRLPEYMIDHLMWLHGYPDPDSDGDSDTEWILDDFPFYEERIYYNDSYWYPFTGNYN